MREGGDRERTRVRGTDGRGKWKKGEGEEWVMGIDVAGEEEGGGGQGVNLQRVMVLGPDVLLQLRPDRRRCLHSGARGFITSCRTPILRGSSVASDQNPFCLADRRRGGRGLGGGFFPFRGGRSLILLSVFTIFRFINLLYYVLSLSFISSLVFSFAFHFSFSSSVSRSSRVPRGPSRAERIRARGTFAAS